MANSVAAPLERRLGEIPGVTEITSTNSIGATSIVIQFDIDRDIDGAAHDVQAAINAATADLPSDLPQRPVLPQGQSGRRADPDAGAHLRHALDRADLRCGRHDPRPALVAGRGVSQVTVNGAEKPAVRVQLDPVRARRGRAGGAGRLYRDPQRQRAAAHRRLPGRRTAPRPSASTARCRRPTNTRRWCCKAGNGAILRLADVATVDERRRQHAARRLGRHAAGDPADHHEVAGRQRHRDGGPASRRCCRSCMSWMPPDIKLSVIADRTTHHPRQRGGRAVHAADHASRSC